MQQVSALQQIQLKILQEFGLIPIFGAELEFFIPPQQDIANLAKQLNCHFIKEQGINQWEINFMHTDNLINLAVEIKNFKMTLQKLFPHSDNIFTAKPFADDYGSALHIHINFIDHAGCYFFDTPSNIDVIANILGHYILSTFIIFAPHSASYERFNPKFMAPTNISYGHNNRSTALRIPDMLPRRLEHRVAGSDTDPYLVIYTILKTIYLGMQQSTNCPKIQKIYGNAFDKQYDLAVFPQNIEIAKQYFNSDFFNI